MNRKIPLLTCSNRWYDPHKKSRRNRYRDSWQKVGRSNNPILLLHLVGRHMQLVIVVDIVSRISLIVELVANLPFNNNLRVSRRKGSRNNPNTTSWIYISGTNVIPIKITPRKVHPPMGKHHPLRPVWTVAYHRSWMNWPLVFYHYAPRMLVCPNNPNVLSTYRKAKHSIKNQYRYEFNHFAFHYSLFCLSLVQPNHKQP